MSRSSDCRQRTAGGSSVIGKFEKMMNWPGAKLVPRRDERLARARKASRSSWTRSRIADRAMASDQRTDAGRIGRWFLPSVTARSPDPAQERGRPRRRFRDRLSRIAFSIDRQNPFQSFKGEIPREDKGGGIAGSRSGFGPGPLRD